MNECKEAATFLGKQFKESHNRSIFPKGCYHKPLDGNIYFNTNAKGRKSNESEQICKDEQIKGIYLPYSAYR